MARRRVGSNQYKTRIGADAAGAAPNLVHQAGQPKPIRCHDIWEHGCSAEVSTPGQHYGLHNDAMQLHPDCSPPILSELAHHPDPKMRRQVVLHPACPPDVVMLLDVDSDPQVQECAAASPQLPSSMFDYAVAEWKQRLAIVHNPRCPADVLQKIFDGGHNGQSVCPVCKSMAGSPNHMALAASHPNAPAGLLHRLMRSHDPIDLCAVAGCPTCPPDALQEMGTHKDPEVRRQVARNPSTPPEILTQMLSDQDEGVRRQALEHPQLPEEYRQLGRVTQ
jgi:hypothetical protein